MTQTTMIDQTAATTKTPASGMSALEKRSAISLAGLYALRMFGLFAILPVLAIEAQSYAGATPTMIGLALGIYGAGQAIFQLPFGMLSDRFGRKRMITIGLLIFALGSLVAAMSSSIYGLVLGRALQGAGAISATVLALASDLSRASERGKMMAIIGASIGASFVLAIILGPILVGLLGLSGLFYVIALLSMAAIVLLWRIVPTPQQSRYHADTSFNRALVLKVMADTQLWRLVIGVLLLHMIMIGVFLMVPPLLDQELGLSNEAQWRVYVPAVVIGFVLIVRSLRNHESSIVRRYLSWSIVGLMLTVLLIFPAIYVGYWAVLAVMLLFFAAFNYIEATQPALISRLAPPAGRGTAMALFSMGQFLGAFLGGVLLGWLQSIAPDAIIVVLLLVLLALWWWLIQGLNVPDDVRSEAFELSDYWASRHMDLAIKLENIEGVLDWAYSDEKAQIIYIKLDHIKLKRDPLIQLLNYNAKKDS